MFPSQLHSLQYLWCERSWCRLMRKVCHGQALLSHINILPHTPQLLSDNYYGGIQQYYSPNKLHFYKKSTCRRVVNQKLLEINLVWPQYSSDLYHQTYGAAHHTQYACCKKACAVYKRSSEQLWPSYTLNPIMSPRAITPRKTMWTLRPVINDTAVSVASSRKKTILRKISTELFTPGSNAFNTRSERNPRGSGEEDWLLELSCAHSTALGSKFIMFWHSE